MRMKLNANPAHGSNSLYTGSSIRLSRKATDTKQYISTYLTQFGNGQADPHTLSIYNEIQGHIQNFSSYSVDGIINNMDLMEELYTSWSLFGLIF